MKTTFRDYGMQFIGALCVVVVAALWVREAGVAMCVFVLALMARITIEIYLEGPP